MQVETHKEQLDSIFKALSDPTRRKILERLLEGDATITELAAPFSMSLPAISKHIRILENAGLLQREKKGRTFRCHLSASPMQEADDYLAFYKMFWDGSDGKAT